MFGSGSVKIFFQCHIRVRNTVYNTYGETLCIYNLCLYLMYTITPLNVHLYLYSKLVRFVITQSLQAFVQSQVGKLVLQCHPEIHVLEGKREYIQIYIQAERFEN